MERNKIKVNYKLVISLLLLLLLLSIILLITFTYAWFISARKATMDGIAVNIEAPDDQFEISVDAKNWKNSLTMEDFQKETMSTDYPTNNNKFPQSLVPCSTDGSVDSTNKNLLMYKGNIRETKTDLLLTTKKLDETTQNEYIAFDVFLKTKNDMTLMLGTDSGPVPEEGNSSMVHAATRIGIVKCGSGLTESEEAQNAVVNSSKLDRIFEPWAGKRSESSIPTGERYGYTTESIAEGKIVPYKAANEIFERCWNTRLGT